jgi:hypothetical protein
MNRSISAGAKLCTPRLSHIARPYRLRHPPAQAVGRTGDIHRFAPVSCVSDSSSLLSDEPRSTLGGDVRLAQGLRARPVTAALTAPATGRPFASVSDLNSPANRRFRAGGCAPGCAVARRNSTATAGVEGVPGPPLGLPTIFVGSGESSPPHVRRAADRARANKPEEHESAGKPSV